MPGRDRTGPFGAGMLTGRGMGPCRGYRADYGPYYRRRFSRFGGFGGFGPFGGIGRPWGFWTESDVDEKEALREHRDFLRRRLEEIDKELDD